MPSAIAYWLILIGLCLILGASAASTHCRIHHATGCELFRTAALGH